jgi:glycosyltransferase involved in cell wall biosynthesis
MYALLAPFACSFSVSMVDSIQDYRSTARARLFSRFTGRRSARIDCLSTDIRSEFGAFLGGEHASKCRVAPCSFTEVRVPTSPPPRDIDVSMIARMIPSKGHGLLCKALNQLSREGRAGLSVHVCGSGPAEAEIRAGFEAVQGQQIQIRYEPDPIRTLLRSKVFVSLQDVENYPSQSLLEAMTCGCAIVATDVGLTRQLLNEDCAILVPPEPGALAAALRRLMETPLLRQQMGAEAQRVVTTQQTIDRFAAYFVRDIFNASWQEPGETALSAAPADGAAPRSQARR